MHGMLTRSICVYLVYHFGVCIIPVVHMLVIGGRPVSSQQLEQTAKHVKIPTNTSPCNHSPHYNRRRYLKRLQTILPKIFT